MLQINYLTGLRKGHYEGSLELLHNLLSLSDSTNAPLRSNPNKFVLNRHYTMPVKVMNLRLTALLRGNFPYSNVTCALRHLM